MPEVFRRPLFLARVAVVCSMGLVFWSFLTYVKMRELVDLGVSLNNRAMLVENKHKVGGGVSGFNPVDRSQRHLYTVALAWAKKHGMESSVQNLYHSSRSTTTKSISKPVVRKKSLAKPILGSNSVKQKPLVHRPLKQTSVKKKNNRAYLKNDSWEPRFSLPIPRSQWRLSSPFGPRRLKGRRGFHPGVDMAAARGIPVKAAGDGVVVVAGFAGAYGNVVVIEHDDRFRTRYAHLSAITTRVGREVKEGDMIGRVGATGHVVGRMPTHLHFEVEVSGRRMNPFYFLKN